MSRSRDASRFWNLLQGKPKKDEFSSTYLTKPFKATPFDRGLCIQENFLLVKPKKVYLIYFVYKYMYRLFYGSSPIEEDACLKLCGKLVLQDLAI